MGHPVYCNFLLGYPSPRTSYVNVTPRGRDVLDDDVVVVAGYLTDGPAIKISDKLRIGDVIRLVDGQQGGGHSVLL